ncbi:MAG: hypothetical protein VX672_06780 [Planctomycetota bacterium]|nr:hypothetical protein [Planctomycetota bacterium]
MADQATQLPDSEKTTGTGRVATPLAWSTSILLHLGLLLIGGLVTWSLILIPEDRPVVVLNSPNASQSFEAVSSLASEPTETAPAGGATSAASTKPVEAAELAELMTSADDLLSQSATLAADPGAGEMPGVSFGGVSAPAATRIVFVVDASGSMIGAFPSVVREVERTLRQLDPRQSFSLVLFREGEVLGLPDRNGRLRPATAAAVDGATGWMRNQTPKGRSDPSVALRRAFNLDPQVIYVVSTDITGAGAYEVDREELFALLDELNPRDGRGRRDAMIRCIQLLDEDPLGTLREIARRHGVEGDADDRGFAFIDRESLGLD